MIAHVNARELPAGTVTFLFTDVEGSTRLLHEHGPEYADLLAEHRRLLRSTFDQHGGVEVDTQGDAFFIAFRSAADAVTAAATGREALASTPIRVRMGIHTGEPIVTDEGYVGIDVHRAARIAAAAYGGQIVLSSTTAALLGPSDKLSQGPLRDLGEHRLKDLIGAERLYQLGDGDFPPLRTLDATNLPIAASALVGREREVEELVGMLSNGTRLLTLTGPGGTGKTRLALQVAAELVGRLHDGVFWVPLVGLTDPQLLSSEVAKAVGAPDELAGFLRGKELLILLDNFEHLLAAAPGVSEVLGASGDLRILVTSRAPLRVSGEQEYRLDPLPDKDAAALFVERARGVGRDVEADATVESLCRRLDGLPLAVELAAARTKMLAPERLLERLDSVLPILTGGTRDAHERQRTLRATIEWSYDLLDEAGRELFARLSGFAGSFSLDAAERVCDADLDCLASLVDSSLVKPVGDDRFLMLETIREYAREKLEESGRIGEMRRRHADYFAALAEDTYARRLAAEAECVARLELENDDLRAALDWLEETDPTRGLDLAGALGWFWLSHGHLVEGCGRLVDADSATPGRSRARALTASGALIARSGDWARGKAQVEEALELWRKLDDRAELAAVLATLAWLLFLDAGDDPASLDAFEESLALRRELGDHDGEKQSLAGVAQVHVALGDIDVAETESRELLRIAEGDRRAEHFAYHFLADCALLREDTDEAERRYRQSLRAAIPLGDVVETSFEVQGVAMAAAGNGDARRALLLVSSVEAFWESLGVAFAVAFWDRLLERWTARAVEALGEEADAVREEGRALPFEDAVELALQEVTSPAV
jgi:predicted ATPase/class 3 adenylate cyclase